MANVANKKRRGDDQVSMKNRRGTKKQKKTRKQVYDSDGSDSADAADNDSGDDFQAVNLLDSDDDLDNANVDDGASTDSDADESESDSDGGANVNGSGSKAATQNKKAPKRRQLADEEQEAEENDDDNDDDDNDNGSDFSSGSEGGDGRAPTSKRNDPSTFATSMQKILGTKLSTTRRADPVLARSAAARDASRRVVDAALEEKARRLLRVQKRAAMEKGRVKDVLVATRAAGADLEPNAGDAPTTAALLEAERRLRKVAQRGVVKLFNAVRAAQIRAADAERSAKAEGLIGMDKREARVAEMSRKGFLDLIASGGGGLKKGSLEEA